MITMFGPEASIRPPGSSAGRARRNDTEDSRPARSSANAFTLAAAPAPPPFVSNVTVTVWVAFPSTVRFRISGTRSPPACGANLATHPRSASSAAAGRVRATVSFVFPQFERVSV